MPVSRCAHSQNSPGRRLPPAQNHSLYMYMYSMQHLCTVSRGMIFTSRLSDVLQHKASLLNT